MFNKFSLEKGGLPVRSFSVGWCAHEELNLDISLRPVAERSSLRGKQGKAALALH
jgi:hypothetical protein